MKLRGLLLVGLGFCFLFAGYSITSSGSDLPQGQLKLEVAPASANVSIDGKSTKPGEKILDIGPHEVTISRSGFKTQVKAVNITQAVESYIGVILTPDSPETEGWYTNHKDDQQITQSINDTLNDTQNATVSRKYPIFSRLPAIFGNGSDELTKIESEASINNSGKPSIGIYATDPLQRQQALDWVYNRDYIFSDIDVVFYGARIPIAKESTE